MLPPCLLDYAVTINYSTSEAVYKPAGSLPQIKGSALKFLTDQTVTVEFESTDAVPVVSQKVKAMFGHVRRRPTPSGPKPTWMHDLDA